MILETVSSLCSWKFVLLCALELLILWLVYKFVEERLSPLRKLPCPPGSLPLVGHLFTLLRFGGLLQVMRIWTEQYAPMFILHPGFKIGIGMFEWKTKCHPNLWPFKANLSICQTCEE